MIRTHTCGELRLQDINQQVTLCGWVKNIRDKGALLWIDVRDSYGITQIICQESDTSEALFKKARRLGREYVVAITGIVLERGAKNPNLPTGDIEVIPTEIEVLSPAKVPPFLIEEKTDGLEELRMRYRYLDLRRKPIQERLMMRHRLNQEIRSFLNEKGFCELETPTLVKSTPEGARDFVVPARLHPNHYYALPQSPQLFKQLLIIGGIDRYYQMAKCFRDEDPRADRQPEFTQLDAELSFVTEKDVQTLFERLIKKLFYKIRGLDLPPFSHLTHANALKKYGSDKPDLRWGMPFIDITQMAKGKGFQPFDHSHHIIALCLPEGSAYSRKKIDYLLQALKKEYPSLSALAHVKYGKDGAIHSSLSKWYDEATLTTWLEEGAATRGDLLLIVAGDDEALYTSLGNLRLQIAREGNISPQEPYMALWITDFPLLSWDETEGRYHACHHPFTAPQRGDIERLDKEPRSVKARAYDMVINGVEVGGGSIRIHDPALQRKIFALLGLSPSDINAQFGFFLEALQYGTPPHGGIALGLDRLALLLGGGHSIRDYIPFPKNKAGRDVMMDAPAPLPND